MSFGLGLYKDQILNRLGEFKDRTSALLKTIDNCEVSLRVTTETIQDRNMPSSRLYKIRSRSKSKCKHSYTHETERTYQPGHCFCSLDWTYDSDSDCSCDECDPCGCEIRAGRGRSPHRLPIFSHGRGSPSQQNVNQQNINMLPGCCSGSLYGHGRYRSRSQSRSIIVVPHRSHEPAHRIGRLPRHYGGRCCIHGYGPLTICPEGCHPTQYHQLLMEGNGYTPVMDDNGKVDIYNNARLLKRFKDFADAHAKAKKDKDDAEKKKHDDAADMINKLLKPAESAPRRMLPGEYERSAEEVQFELERVNADMDQLHSWISLIAADAAASKEEEQSNQLAMCSGALQGNESKENVQPLKQKQLKSALGKPKKVQFADHFGCKTISRVDGVDSEVEEHGQRHECDCYLSG